jgi:MFS family permease
VYAPPVRSLADRGPGGESAKAPRSGARLHYGWIVVATTFVLLLASAGVRSAPAVLIKPLEADLAWSRGEISWALAVSLLTLGVAGPLSGMAINRYGLRRTAGAFLLFGALGVALTATMSSLLEFHLYWGLLVGFGTGGVSTVLSATVANIWFETRRGLVTGLLGGASSAGQFVLLFPLLAAEESWGWRPAVLGLAGLLALIVLPVTVLLLRSRPADVALRPYGAGSAKALASPGDTRITSLGAATRTVDFWLLAGSFFICGFTTVGLVGFHFIPHAGEHGFSPAEATGLVTLMGSMNIVGTLGSGWLTDRYSARRLLAVYYVLRACSLLVLPAITGLPLMSLFAIVFGLDYIATVPPTVMMTADRFGRRSVPTLFGWISCSHMVGGAVAAAFAGQVHDFAGDYSIPIYVSGVLGLIAAAMAFRVSAHRRPEVVLVPA